MSDFGWTIVRHSAWGYKSDGTFKRAVQSAHVSTISERRRVETAGGVIFASYLEAEEFCEKANYRDGLIEGLIPNVEGRFSLDQALASLEIYVPVRKTVVVG